MLDITNINDFKTGLEFVLKWEGGAKYTNNPADPGGETKYGISKKAHPEEDIKNLTPQRALEIYAYDYWKPLDADSLSSPLNIVAFDTAVNCGVARTKKWLLESNTPEDLLALRKNHYLALVERNIRLGQFLKGWLNRLSDLQKLVYKIQDYTSQ